MVIFLHRRLKKIKCFQHPKFNRDEALALSSMKKTETDPSVFNFYVYLRTHPLIARHALANGQKKGAVMLTGFRGTKSFDQVLLLCNKSFKSKIIRPKGCEKGEYYHSYS